MSFLSRRELLAGYNGEFQAESVRDAIAEGNLREAISSARQLAATAPVDSTDRMVATEFLGEFDPGEVEGEDFDAYVERVTDNRIPVSECSQLDLDGVIARVALDWIAV